MSAYYHILRTFYNLLFLNPVIVFKMSYNTTPSFKSKSILTQAVQEYSDFSIGTDDSDRYYLKSTMYILKNKSLNMTPGKVASQVAHAAEILALRYDNTQGLKHINKMVVLKSVVIDSN